MKQKIHQNKNKTVIDKHQTSDNIIYRLYNIHGQITRKFNRILIKLK